MNIGLVGLGRMGLAIAYRLIKAGHIVFGFDQNQDACLAAKKIGINVVGLKEICGNVNVVWLMVPAGKIVDEILHDLMFDLRAGDVIIDGGNSFYKDSILRGKTLEDRQMTFLDCGTSGGLKGKELGFCLMIGGDFSTYERLKEIFQAVASPNGYAHVGPVGSGHYVKMIHNGIEYAILQSYAEGFHILREGHFKNLDLEKISNVWRHGSVIRSWLLDLTHEVFEQDQTLENISGSIGENKTGMWTVQEAKSLNIPVDLIERSLQIRASSRESGGNFATKIVAMLRNKFGGHEVGKK